MPRRCTICEHPEREAIEGALVQGESYRAISQRFANVSYHALGRHKREGHIGLVVLAPVAEPEILDGAGVLAEMAMLRERAQAIEQAATKGKKPRLDTALRAIREQSRILENVIKLAALLTEHRVQTDLILSAEWVELRTVLMKALAPHPVAKADVVRALSEHGA